MLTAPKILGMSIADPNDGENEAEE